MAPGAPAQIMDAKNINIVIMADSDIFNDQFWVHVETTADGKSIAAPIADNAAFVVNAVENLTGSGDLISLRTRATNDRPFTKVKEIQSHAQEQYQKSADALQARLTDIEAQLHALQQGGSTNGQPSTALALTPEQQTAVETAKRDIYDTRSQLRDVQHNLRKDIDFLGNVLAWINIALVPVLISIFAIVLAELRRRRRRRAAAL
jgi:ABC-type uncharacterized transport system involved in gliding motility auxiliary subunit